MSTNRAISVAVITVVLATGCHLQMPKLTQDAGETETPAHEMFIFLADGTSEQTRLQMVEEIEEWIATCEAGSVLHLIQSPEHRHVVTLALPEGTKQSRLRKVKPDFTKAIPLIVEGTPATEEIASQQLDLPSVPKTVNAMRRTDHPVRVLLIGDAIYRDHERRHLAWEMGNGAVPSDASVKSSVCPFGNGISRWPSGAQISWLVPEQSFGLDNTHTTAVERFYRLWFQEYGAELLRITAASSASFDFTNRAYGDRVTGQFSEPVGLTFPSVPSKAVDPPSLVNDIEFEAGARDVPGHTPPLDSLGGTTDKALQSWIEQATPDQILIATGSIASDPNCDVDMWITSRGFREEIFYSHRESDFGELYRDVQKVLPADATVDNIEDKWECARIDHDRLEDVTLWLNVYRTTARPTVRLVVVWKGERRETSIQLNVTLGDATNGRLSRETSPAWTKVDLMALFADSSTPDANK